MTRAKDLKFALIGKSRETPFSPLRLPTNEDVIQRFLYHFKVEKETKQKSINLVCKEIENMWKKVSAGETPGYTCYQSVTTTKKKLNTLCAMYKAATKFGENPTSMVAIQHQRNFRSALNKLFDISKPNIQEKLSPTDYEFIKDQQSSRIYTFGGIDNELRKRLSRKRARETLEIKRSESSAKNALAMQSVSTDLIEGISTTDTESTSSNIETELQSATTSKGSAEFISLEVPRKVARLPQVVAAADRHGLSSNALNDVLAALIRESNGKVENFILSTSTTSRARQKVRQTEFQSIKEQFKDAMKTEFLTIHWDEKLLKEGRDLTQKEHVAVLSSYGDETKLLGTMTLESGSGLNQAEAIMKMMKDWEIEGMCVAMCFDTTASNTGRFSGACILLEALLGHSLLWTACRHHTHEVILATVFKSIFGVSSSPQVDFFQLLKKKWYSLDFTKETTHIQMKTTGCFDEDIWSACVSLDKIKSTGSSYIPRDDYEELLNLSTFFIRKESFQKFPFRRPGAQHRARWMSSCIYTLKMLLLQGQLDLAPDILNGLWKFGSFVAVFYATNWFQSPLASEAAFNDLQLYKKMLEYKAADGFREIAEVVITALNRHLWYLTEELIPFALCSKQLSFQIKEKLAYKMYHVYQEYYCTTFAPQKTIFPKISESTEVDDLVGERSVLIFQRFKFTVDDIQFLKYATGRWPEFDCYNRLEKLVTSMKVVNDTAERGIKILEDFKDILTQDPDQRNLILHSVENVRKQFPDFRKKTLARHPTTPSQQN